MVTQHGLPFRLPGLYSQGAEAEQCMVPIPWIDTKRLRLRGFRQGDLSTFMLILQDREVLKYLPRTEPWSTTVTKTWLASQAHHWRKHGFGWWIVVEQSTDAVLGWCGLRRLQETGEVELLYMLGRSAWGKGYASEAAVASVAYAFHKTSLQALIGLVHPDNAASIQVLHKVGMRRKDRCSYFGLTLEKYRLTRAAYMAVSDSSPSD